MRAVISFVTGVSRWAGGLRAVNSAVILTINIYALPTVALKVSFAFAAKFGVVRDANGDHIGVAV